MISLKTFIALFWGKSVPILRAICGLSATVVLLFFILTFWLPIYLFRWFVIIVTEKTTTNLGQILSPMDHMLAQSSAGPQSKITVTCTLNGDFTAEKLQALFTKNIISTNFGTSTKNYKIERNSSASEQLRYLKLQQYPVRWLGFLFFKNDQNFRIQNHIAEYSNDAIMDPSLIHQELLNKPFPPGRSPWELLVIRNRQWDHRDKVCNNYKKCESEGANRAQTLLAFRIHHCLADGISVLKLFVEGLGNKALVKASPRPVTRSAIDNIKFFSLLPINIGHDYIKCWHDVWFYQKNLFSVSGPIYGESESVVGITNKMSMTDIKKIAKRCNVTFSAVITSLIVSSLKKFANFDETKDGKVVLPVAYVLPRESHPNVLTNHWVSTYELFPLETMDPYQSVRKCDELLNTLKSNSSSYLMKYSVFFCGTTFHVLCHPMLKNRICSVVITNIAGDEEGFSLDGRECMDFTMSTAGVQQGIGIFFCILSYKNYIRISCAADTRLMSSEDVVKLANLLSTEFLCTKKELLLEAPCRQ